uniref:Uncharacterized protein n=1 Tax=Nelumbo nucifera TaxID=4432 RepID=A0A822YKD2_NELNU|nr:TPA_asm: hypothetical protein HUJ06_010862 [Nelumbo nucifera]
MLYWPMSNVLYVEGYALDRFAEGSWALQPVHQNKVGLVLDAGIEEELRIRHLQVADAAKASLGLPVLEYIVTDTPLQVYCHLGTYFVLFACQVIKWLISVLRCQFHVIIKLLMEGAAKIQWF